MDKETKIILSVFLFFLLLIFRGLRKKYWGVCNYIFSVYAFSLFFSIILYRLNFLFEDEIPSEITIRSALVFCILLFLFLSPFYRPRPCIEAISRPSYVNKIEVAGSITSIVLIFACLLISPIVVRNMSMDFSALRAGDGLRFQTSFIEGIGLKILDILSPLSYYLLVTFFYSVSRIRGRKRIDFMLLIASLSAPYYGLLYGGRTQVIYWLLAFLFCCFLFRPYMEQETKRMIIRVAIVFFAVLFCYLAISTISRFSESILTTEGSLLLYIGQPFLYFSDFLETYTPDNVELGRVLPFTSYILNGPFDLEQYRMEIWTNSGRDIGIFYTFLGDLFVDIGMVGIICYLVIYNLLARILLKSGSLDYPKLLMLTTLILMPLHGLFYYSYWKMQVSFCIILVLFYCLSFGKKTDVQS